MTQAIERMPYVYETLVLIQTPGMPSALVSVTVLAPEHQ